MTRPLPLAALALALGLGACALNLGGPRDIPMTTVAVRVDTDATAGAVAAAVREARARAAFVAAPRDAAWFRSLADASDMDVVGPAGMGDLDLVFLGPEPVGDTTLTLPYDGGTLTILDALYEVRDDRLLDLLAVRIDDPDGVRPAIASLLEYVASDVNNAAALVMAVLVPTAAVGDSVARMLSPAYYDAIRCEPGAAAPSEKASLRLFYGPEARMYCADAAVADRAVGGWVRADFVMGRR